MGEFLFRHYEYEGSDERDPVGCNRCGSEDVPTASFRAPPPRVDEDDWLCELCAYTTGHRESFHGTLMQALNFIRRDTGAFAGVADGPGIKYEDDA